MERANVDGVEIEISHWARGDRSLFLHGEDYFNQHRPFLEALAARWRVIVPRHPGFGTSPPAGDSIQRASSFSPRRMSFAVSASLPSSRLATATAAEAGAGP